MSEVFFVPRIKHDDEFALFHPVVEGLADMTVHAFASGNICISPLGWSSMFVCGYLFGFGGGLRVTTEVLISYALLG